MKNAVSEQPESKLNNFKQSTQKDEQRRCYREEGENRAEGHGDRWIQVLTKLNGRQAEGTVFSASFFLNKLYRGNRRKFIMSHIFNNLL